MSALNWLQSANRLFIPYHSVAKWRFLANFGCNCEEETIECEFCDGGLAPKFIQAIVAGVTDDYCSNCDVLNGTHILTFGIYPSSPCLWNKAWVVTCNPPDLPFWGPAVQVYFSSITGKLFGFLGDPSTNRGAYYGNIDNSDCLNWSNVVLSKYAENPFFCSDYPNSFTISAI